VGKRRTRATWLLTAALVILLGLASVSQVVVETLSLATTVLPSSVVTLVFRVTNTAVEARTLQVAADLPSGWTVLVLPHEIALAPGAGDTVLMLVRIPAAGLAGTYDVGLCIRDPVADTVCATSVVTIEPHLAIHVESQSTLAKGLPGGSACFDLLVTNRGNLTSEYEIIVRSLAWRAEARPSRLTLFPGETEAVTLEQFIPSSAIPGNEDTIHVAVVSIVDPTVTDRATLRSGVLPLPTAEVSTDLGLVLNMSTDFAIEATFNGVTRSVVKIAAMGEAVGGIVSVRGTASGFLGGGAVAISHTQGQFANDILTVTYGSGAQQFSRFVSLKGDGIAIELERGSLALDGIAFGSGTDETQGARFSIDTDTFDASLGWAKLMSGGSVQDVLVGRLALELATSSLVTAEYAQGTDGAAAHFCAQWKSGVAMLRGEVVLIRVPFLAHTTESSRGISLDGRMAASTLSLSGSFAHSQKWDPAAPEEWDFGGATRMGVNGRIGTGSFSLGSSVAWSGNRGTSVLKESFTQGVHGTVSQTWNSLLRLSFSGSLRHRESALSATEYLLSDVSMGFQTSVGAFRFDACLGASITQDVLLDTTSTQITERVSLARTEAGLPMSMCLMAQQEDGKVIGLVGELTLGKVTVYFERDTAAEVTFGFSYFLELPFTLSAWPVKGQVEGMLYVDENMNGLRDAAERGLEGILLSIDHTQALTDGDGQFRFPPKELADYRLQALNLPVVYIPVDNLPMPIRLFTPGAHRVEIGVVEAASVRGQVVAVPGDQGALGSGPFLLGVQRQTDGRRYVVGSDGLVSHGLPGISIELTDGRTTRVQLTDSAGCFRFDRLLPGWWTITVDPAGLPRYHEMSTPSRQGELRPGQVSDLD